ncbi:relaxase/mobilization nuclease domain-containing protein, partial [Salmonella enterica subsp. enterica serovar Braenderup]|nr:relaxase/mobilization nuclease domain-containing protein [Salmonella enterica subsp. enterica serovar Braenderup]
ATHTKNAERVGGNMAGNDPRELSREFSAVRQLRPDIGKPVWHCSLSLPPGERLSAEKWEAVTTDFMQRMGFDQTNTPWVAVRHQDTDKDHIHIVASRVGLDGKVWLGQWEARSAIEATQELEHTHGLTLTPGLGDARAERRKLTDKEINMAVRTGDEPPRQRLQRLLDEAVKDKPTAPELADRLHAAGVGVRANLASTGRMNGFSFEVAGVPFKGSDLGKGYT